MQLELHQHPGSCWRYPDYRPKGTINISIYWPNTAWALVHPQFQGLFLRVSAVMTYLGEFGSPGREFIECPSHLGRLAPQRHHEHARGTTTDAFAPVRLPGLVVELFDVDGGPAGD